ncbi:putative baseplate assembly protein [Hydrogenophaga sp.]|uniref:putative baseplate assembly protein n=1 Tax=Hydrogenophaga sp. TaxID=1904254 RepID=UPI0025BD53CC|nr:putative baseplate assembly protein [Hydrogenophaga sp.]MBT9465003.1 putative baseplate assembly protein [Hydrogenophaga sp.]
MPIVPPSLDDRRFDDLVEDLIARIPAHTPEWTNPRQGDPGRTLIELFAWLGDALLYRANLIPERQRLVFLKLLGQALRPAQPAGGIVGLSYAQPLADLRASSLLPGARLKGAQPFETLGETTVLPVTGETYIKRRLSDAEAARMADVISGLSRVHRISGAVQGYETLAVFGEGRAETGGFDVFERSTDRALWIALLAPAAPGPLEQVDVNDSVRAALGGGDTGVPSLLSLGIVPALPLPALFEEVGPLAEVPVIWEMVTRQPGTQALDYLTLEPLPGSDTSRGFTRPGLLRLPLPGQDDIWVPSNQVGVNPLAGVGDAPPRLDDAARAARLVAWLRVRPRPGSQVQRLPLTWLGINAAEVDQRVTLQGQVLGTSSGAADQSFALPAGSVDGETLVIEVEEPGGRGFQPWRRVDDLAAISADALTAREAGAFELDAEAGTVRFGDGVRGRIPERLMRVRLARGRFGGGRAGNLAPGSLSEIAATLINGQRAPAMKVYQPLAMDGGEDAETLPQAERRIPATLRHQQRAVTADDFKRLALETPVADVGRVEVMPRFKPRDRRFHVPGVVSVVVLPSAALAPAPNPRPDRPFIERVHAHLSARVPLATELYVIGCEYVPLGLSVALRLREGFARDKLLYEVREALRRLLWPLAPGGLEGEGWALGRSVRERELEVEVSRVAGVAEVTGLQLFARQGAAGQEDWALLPRNQAGAQQTLNLLRWQLPELLSIVVVEGAEAPTNLRALPNPFAQANAVAVPVVPELC